MYRNDAVEDRAMAIGNTDYIAPRTVFVFSFFIFFRFCAVRWTELAISSAFERTLIYRIVTCITNSSAVADKLARRTVSRLTAKFAPCNNVFEYSCDARLRQKQSCDHNHAPFVGDMSSCCQTWYSLLVYKICSAVPVIWLEHQNFVMGHMTWPRPNQGRFVVCRLWLAHSTFTLNL